MIDVMTYDIKNEQAAYRDCQNPVQKFFIFKTANDDFDCDVSYFALKAARKIYPFLAEAKIRKQENSRYNRYGLKYEFEEIDDSTLVYRGDTCNSFQKLYIRAVTKLLFRESFLEENSDYWHFVRKHGYKKDEKLEYLLAKHDGLSKDFAEKLPLSIGELLNELARLVHTLPNMIALPKDINASRYTRTSDNFSIFLYAVYRYLSDKKDECLIKAIYDSEFELAKSYLDSFGGWQKYVEMNLLESYVDDNYVPREFIKGQFKGYEDLVFMPKGKVIEECTCPQNADEYVEYLTNVISIIKSRGVQLAAIYEKT